MKPEELEERLIDFAVQIIHLVKDMPRSNVGLHLSNQLTRSGTSLALNYGEAQGAESRRDFIHKMRISPKEMRETIVCLKIIKRSGLITSEKMDQALA